MSNISCADCGKDKATYSNGMGTFCYDCWAKIRMKFGAKQAICECGLDHVELRKMIDDGVDPDEVLRRANEQLVEFGREWIQSVHE